MAVGRDTDARHSVFVSTVRSSELEQGALGLDSCGVPAIARVVFISTQKARSSDYETNSAYDLKRKEKKAARLKLNK